MCVSHEFDREICMCHCSTPKQHYSTRTSSAHITLLVRTHLDVNSNTCQRRKNPIATQIPPMIMQSYTQSIPIEMPTIHEPPCPVRSLPASLSPRSATHESDPPSQSVPRQFHFRPTSPISIYEPLPRALQTRAPYKCRLAMCRLSFKLVQGMT